MNKMWMLFISLGLFSGINAATGDSLEDESYCGSLATRLIDGRGHDSYGCGIARTALALSLFACEGIELSGRQCIKWMNEQNQFVCNFVDNGPSQATREKLAWLEQTCNLVFGNGSDDT